MKDIKTQFKNCYESKAVEYKMAATHKHILVKLYSTNVEGKILKKKNPRNKDSPPSKQQQLNRKIQSTALILKS